MDKSFVTASLVLGLIGGVAGGFFYSHFFNAPITLQPPQLTLATNDLEAERTPHELYRNCSDDISKFCEQKKDALLVLADCLENAKERLSTDCLRDVSRIHMILLPCRDEAERFCASISLGGGRLHRCLVQNFKQTGEKCRTALAGL